MLFYIKLSRRKKQAQRKASSSLTEISISGFNSNNQMANSK